MICPICGKEITRTFRGIDETTHLCTECGWTDDKYRRMYPDERYGDFAKEMARINQSLRDEIIGPSERSGILNGIAGLVYKERVKSE